MKTSPLHRIFKRQGQQLANNNGARAAQGGYMPNGTFPHGKSADGLSQWLLEPSGNLPVPAFGMHPALVRRLFAFVHTVPSDATGEQLITQFADSQFRSCWAEVRSRFAAEAAGARRRLARFGAERETVAQQLKDTPERIPEAAPRLELTHGFLARAAGVAWFLVWLALCAFTVFNCQSLLVLVLQDGWRAVSFALPLLLPAIGLKLALDKSGRGDSVLKSPWIAVLIAGAGAFFAYQLGETFGRTRSLEEIAEIATVGRDWSHLLWASLSLEILAGGLIYHHLCTYVVRRQLWRRNPDYDRVQQRLAQLDDAWSAADTVRERNEGWLQEWEKSRESFVSVGLAYRRLLAERRRIVDENRLHLETLHKLWLPRDDGHDDAHR